MECAPMQEGALKGAFLHRGTFHCEVSGEFAVRGSEWMRHLFFGLYIFKVAHQL